MNVCDTKEVRIDIMYIMDVHRSRVDEDCVQTYSVEQENSLYEGAHMA